MTQLPDLVGIAGVLLDAVGTIIDPHPSVAEVYASAARRQGVEFSTDEVRGRFRAHFGADEVDEFRGPLATDEATESRRWRRIVGGVLPGLPDPDRAFEELWAHFARPDSWRCHPDVAPALRSLNSGGIALRIGSNFDGRLRGVLRGLPELAGLGIDLAETAVISSEVGRRKPHPDFYRKACERLGLPPGRVLCVGDDPENDLRGPRRAGLPALLIDRSGRLPADLPRLTDLRDLAEILDR